MVPTYVASVNTDRRPDASEGAQERYQVLLLGLRQLHAEDEIEELHGVVEGQEPAVVQVRGRVLDPAQGEGLDRPIHRGHPTVDQLRAEEALGAEVVHEVVGVVRGRMTGRA